jgi:hypothetical protein
MQQSSIKPNTGSSWLHKLILFAALAGAVIQIHLAFPGGSFDGRLYIPRDARMERPESDVERSAIPGPARQRAGRPGHHRPP